MAYSADGGAPGEAPRDGRVRYEKRGPVAYVTLNRPAVLNALDLQTHEQLARIWDDFERDDALRVGVLTGAGDRAFCVGQDLKELAARLQAGAQPTTFGSRGLAGWPRLTERFHLSKPLVARVNGYAFGGGFELALACDIIVAADHASFALPEARLGLVPGAGGVFRLCRQLPFRTALGHLLTGRGLDAARALELGLINEVVPAERLDVCVSGWVEDLLRCAPLSVRAIKEAACKSVEMPLEQAFATRYEWEEMPLEQAFATRYEWEECRLQGEDCREGPLAFVEKRPPRWLGR